MNKQLTYVYNNSHPPQVVTPWMDDCVSLCLVGRVTLKAVESATL